MSTQRHPNLREQLRGFYGDLELPQPLAEELLQSATRPRAPRRSIVALLAAAALIVGLAVVAFLNRGGRTDDVTQIALAEVAHNHLKGLDPELVSDDYAAIQEQLSRLDFDVAPPQGSLMASFELLGGRYCKVQGVFAAQFKLHPPEGGPAATGYVVPADGPLADIGTASGTFEGVRVRCERVGSRLLFLAESARE